MTPGWTVARRVPGGGIEVLPMAATGSGWLCTEGDTVVVDAMSAMLPKLGMAGRSVAHTELTFDADGFRARFEIFIDSWAGITRLESVEGQDVRPILLDVRPHARKLGVAGFDEMLAELSRRSAGLIWGMSPGAAKGHQASGALAVVHPAVLRSQLPAFLRHLRSYLADPPTRTIRVTRPRAFELARKPDLPTLRRLGRQPALLRALTGEGDVGRFADPRQPIEQPEVTASLDHPMTRYLAHLLRKLLLRFRTSEEVLRAVKGRPYPDPAILAQAGQLADEMAVAANEMQRWLTAPLLRAVRPEPLDSSALQALADQPVFGALHRIGRLLLDPGLAYGPDGTVESALKHSYDLFELFVLFRLVDALPFILGPEWEERSSASIVSGGWEERPPNGAEWSFAGPDGLTLTLLYQQRFPRAGDVPDMRPFSSLSGECRPDYMLLLQRGSQPISWTIMDAKYRSGRQSVDAGLQDVHRYRDALRVLGLKAAGAFVIVPDLQDENPPYASSNFLKHHAFGVIRLSASGWTGPISDLLQTAAHSHHSLTAAKA